MMESAPTVPDLERIWILLEHRRPELAEKAARQRLVADPTDWASYTALAQALMQQAQFTEAMQAAGEAIRLAPMAYQTHYVLSLIQGRTGQLLKADKTVLEALRLAPYSAQLYGYRAQLCYLLGQYTAAQHCAEQGLYFNAEELECLLWRALAQEALDYPAEAAADFARMLHLAPNNGQLHRNLGKVLLRRSEPQVAARHLTEALRLSPNRAGELVPLLRQARSQATWPAWLLQATHEQAQERALGLEPGLRALWVYLASRLFKLRAKWLTRQDPLFQLSNVQRWRRRLWMLLLSMPLLILAVSLSSSDGVLDITKPFTMPQMTVLAVYALLVSVGVQLIKRQIDKATIDS